MNKTKRYRRMRRIWALFLAVALFAGAFPLSVSVSAASKIGADAKVASGYYRLVPYCAPKTTVTIQSASKKAGGNVYISTRNNTKPSKVFYIKAIGNSLYTIQNLNSGLYVEVRSGKTAVHTNIQQGKYLGKAYQKWYISKKKGRYVFQSAIGNRVMTVKNSKNASGVNIWTQKYLGTKGQLYTLEKVSTATANAMVGKTTTTKAATTTTAKATTTTTAAASTKTASTTASVAAATTSTAAATAAAATATAAKTAAVAAAQTLKALTGYTTSSRTWNNSRDLAILTNIVGAVESGGQIYGKRNYAAYEPAYANSKIEYTCTLGWAQFYGAEAKQLIVNIYNKNKTEFVKIVKKYYPNKNGKVNSGYTAFMNKVTTSYNWVTKKWNPSATDKKLLIALITTSIGKKCQDELFQSQMKTMIDYCKKTYTSNAWAVQMYCEIRHLGGAGPAKRIFDKCKKAGSYSLGMIMAALAQDQLDQSSSNQVGDTKYWQRHLKCAEFLQKYAA